MKRILYFILLLSMTFGVLALDNTQKATLKTAALAEPTLTTAIQNGDDTAVATWLNTQSSFVVWRTSVSCKEYRETAIVWTAVDALTNGKARIWEWMCLDNFINPSKINVRQGFIDAFGAASATTTAATATSKRNATNAERALATGTGTNGTPGLLTFEGAINVNDVPSIMRP
jgi:hypothetical protein